MMRARTLALAAAVVLTLGGCSQYDDGLPPISTTMLGASPVTGGGIGPATYRAVDRMLDSAPAVAASAGPIVVGSVSDIRDVDRSGPFGDLIADLVRTRLVQKGLPVVELRLRSAVHLDGHGGATMLGGSRRALMPPPRAAEIVTGTYTVGLTQIYVSLRLIAAADARILGAADFTMPRWWTTERLFATGN